MTLLRQDGNDLFDRRKKAHVEHPIRFVEDEGFEAIQSHIALSHQVEQPARSGDEDIDASSQCPLLRCVANATDDDGLTQLEATTVGREALVNLLCEFPCRSENKYAWLLGDNGSHRLSQTVEDRQRKCRRFPRSGLSTAEQIATGEQVRNGLRLDWRRGRVVFSFKCQSDWLDKFKISKRRRVQTKFLSWLNGHS